MMLDSVHVFMQNAEQIAFFKKPSCSLVCKVSGNSSVVLTLQCFCNLRLSQLKQDVGSIYHREGELKMFIQII